jgi:hypothetical protein
MPLLFHFYLIPQPLLPWERGWGEAAFIKGADGIIKET